MEGFSDLLWLLIMFLVITRALGGARKGKEPPKPAEAPRPAERLPERSSRPTEPAARRPSASVQRAATARDPVQPGPGQRARAAKRSDPMTEFRRRLLEAAREWEAEQRRRAGVPIEDPPRAAPRRPDAEVVPRRPSSWETRDVTPDRVAEQRAVREEAPPPRVTERRAERGAPIKPVEIPEAETPPADHSPTKRPAHEPLARLERFDPLKRAVVLAEILGLPKATSGDPPSGRGAR